MLFASLSIVGCKDSAQDPDPETGSETGVEPGSTEDGPTGGDTTGADDEDSGTTGVPGCDPDNQVPAAPTVLTPTDGTRNLDTADILIQSSAFSDPDGGVHSASEFQIWRTTSGVPTELVWAAASTAGSSLLQVTLDDGELDGTAGADGTLRLWADHVVRVRHRDDSGDLDNDCGWSEWSEDVGFQTDDGSQYLFDQTTVRDIFLEIPPDSWEGIDAEARPPGCVPWNRQYYTGSVTFEGQEFAGVGLRAKGGCGSSRDLDGKAAFRINLNWDDPAVEGCPETRRLYGQKQLTLNNMVQDGSFLHERLAYRLYQEFDVPTPRVAHIRVHVNGEYWGLYLLVETPKRRFLDRRFDSKNGMLYEGTYWCDLIAENVPPGEEDDYCLERKFSPSPCDGPPEPDEDPRDYEVLREMVETLDSLPIGGFYPQIEDTFNFDTFLSAWAVEGVIAHWDNYGFNIINNYRVYHDPSTDLWNLVPHGVDQTFGGDLDPWDVSARLPTSCLEEPACEAAFAARFAEVNETFQALDLAAEVDTINALIVDEVYADPRKEVSNAEYDARQEQARDWIEQRPDRVLEILIDHGF